MYTESDKVNASSTKMTFEEFRKRKEESRSQSFPQKGKHMAAKRGKLEAKQAQDITIQVGLMSSRDGDLKVNRGSNLPLKVNPSVSYEDLRSKAVQKHSIFNTALLNRPTAFKLLYPDKRVAEKVPDTDKDFTLKLYKECLGKPYSRITLFLVTQTDYLEHVESVESDDDSTDPHVEPLRSKQVDGVSTSTKTSTSSFANTFISTVTTSATCSTATTTSCLSTTTYVIDDHQPSTSGMECPICLDVFPCTEIEEHSATCCGWLVDE